MYIIAGCENAELTVILFELQAYTGILITQMPAENVYATKKGVMTN